MVERHPGFQCRAYSTCDNLGNARGGCQHLVDIPYDRAKLTTKQHLEEIETRLASMQACLISIVSLLDLKD